MDLPRDDEILIADSNPVFGLEARGFEHIPEAERNMKLGQIAPLWLGVNLNMVNISLGCLAVAGGLAPWLAFTACLVGNLPFLLLGPASIGAVRVGLPVTTLSRAAYGLQGNLVHAGLMWAASICFEALNTVIGVLAWLALMGMMGLDAHGAGTKILAVAVQLVVGGGVAVLGHATMIYFQRIFSAVLGVTLLAVLAVTLGRTDLLAHLSIHGHLAPLAAAAAFMTACGVIASQPISYLYNGPDWVRYLPSQTPARAIFNRVVHWTFWPCLLLTGMGVLWASLGDMSDPVAGLKPFLPPWLYIVFIGAVIAGSVANNAPTFYSSGLSLQAAGLRLSRWAATLLDIVISTGLVFYILFVQDLSAVLNNFIALLVAWSGPYAGVWLTDGLMRAWRLDLHDIHPALIRGLKGARWRKEAWIAFGLGVAAAVLTMRSPFFTGPVANALGGADLSWVLGLTVSSALYVMLKRRRR